MEALSIFAGFNHETWCPTSCTNISMPSKILIFSPTQKCVPIKLMHARKV